MGKIRNRFEKKIETLLKRKKVKFKYEAERISYILSGYYLPDFVLETSLGKVYLETKGHFRPEAKRKMVAVKRQHPELDIRIIFYSRKAKDIRWAEKHGFLYSIDTIPDTWYEGLF